MKKYTFLFSVAYLLLSLVLVAVADFLKLKGGASFGVATVLGASFLAAWKFTKDHEREPTLDEKKSYAWQALVGVWLISLLVVIGVFAVFFSPSEINAFINLMATKTFLFIFAGGAIFISAIYYVAIRWSFAWYAKLSCKSKHAA